MSLRIVIDMNLPPNWVDRLSACGWSCVHWSTVGDHRAPDHVIMEWARTNGYVVLTHDMDFGTMLALAHVKGPSVIQVRGRDVLVDHMAPVVVAALKQHRTDLSEGALVVVDEVKSRVRLLPI